MRSRRRGQSVAEVIEPGELYELVPRLGDTVDGYAISPCRPVDRASLAEALLRLAEKLPPGVYRPPRFDFEWHDDLREVVAYVWMEGVARG